MKALLHKQGRRSLAKAILRKPAGRSASTAPGFVMAEGRRDARAGDGHSRCAGWGSAAGRAAWLGDELRRHTT